MVQGSTAFLPPETHPLGLGVNAWVRIPAFQGLDLETYLTGEDSREYGNSLYRDYVGGIYSLQGLRT